MYATPTPSHQQTDIIAQAIHDIQSPLSGMKVLIQSIEPQTRQLLGLGLERIQYITDSLRLQTSKTQSPQTCELESFLKEVISEKKIEYKNLEHIRFHLKSDGPCYSAIAGHSFKRVLSNLINNAVESIQARGLIEVRLYNGASTNIITISDNGVGIPSQWHRKVFHKGVSYQKPQGTGLGLFHAKQTVVSHGGSISLRSQPGFGSEITILLPKLG